MKLPRKAEGVALAVRIALVSIAIAFEMISYLANNTQYNECIAGLNDVDRCLTNADYTLTQCSKAALAKEVAPGCTPLEGPITHPCFADMQQASVECADAELQDLISDFSGWPEACEGGLTRQGLCTSIKPSINVLIVLALLGAEAYISLFTEVVDFRHGDDESDAVVPGKA
mmetsp:Transcript_71764/g.149857  ORF Transcript_71764/g.149857 Transcript_71764/m.149857 type:complete len:172 (+) Transcript_71764:95-610(+)|eukprot:CAMPEP_0181290192 /NCGR_PEP_ID=MMETSP1101-20121128/1286_1 /TAXON_ID=46948 /ORGANISM="Rhodomonas abbreviata, Strain Caron Lab Isolate" /LENGTH=171 /DNA_ID=CAMNT_0023394467 /DNA_START=95 /DNA_END=610 /DNA_ORIENTATION=-